MHVLSTLKCLLYLGWNWWNNGTTGNLKEDWWRKEDPAHDFKGRRNIKTKTNSIRIRNSRIKEGRRSLKLNENIPRICWC